MAGAGVAVLAVAAAATVGLGTGRPKAPDADPRAAKTVPVTHGDLVDYVVLDGTVGYGPPASLRCEATGITTWLAPVGSVVRRGGSLLRVDDQPVVLLYGSLPMYRQLAASVIGKDVEQFEENLQELGYTGFTVDEVFSAATTAAVKRWQRDIGRPETGTVEVGQIAYGPGPVRIAGQSVRVGTAVPGDVLTYTGTTRVVTANVEQSEAGWASPGVKVVVTLPDGGTTPGVVRTAGDQVASQSPTGEGAAPAQADGRARITIAITVADQKALSGATRGSVEVRHAAQERKDVLTVPVSALLALAEGGYGLEVVEDTTSRIVAVKAGMFADGRVEVSGSGIDAGTMVRIPQ